MCEYKMILLSIDQDTLERAISNIVQNAIKYTQTGTITIDLKEKNQKVIITISDTGVGISEKDLPYVFDRFYKVEHSRNANSGSGLGLPIAKMLVREHRGKTHIESKVNSGTIVTITIPKS